MHRVLSHPQPKLLLELSLNQPKAIRPLGKSTVKSPKVESPIVQQGDQNDQKRGPSFSNSSAWALTCIDSLFGVARLYHGRCTWSTCLGESINGCNRGKSSLKNKTSQNLKKSSDGKLPCWMGLNEQRVYNTCAEAAEAAEAAKAPTTSPDQGHWSHNPQSSKPNSHAWCG